MKKLKILTIVCALVMATNVHAALQSRPGLDAKKNTMASDFFKYIREMEAEDGALGLNANFSENALGAYEETTSSNNIDVHMCKNTEWGATAMLSASKYGAGIGNVKNDYDTSTKTYGVTASTTKNMTGVFGLNSGAANNEYTAAGILSKMKTSYNKYLINAPDRYVDSYTDGTSSSDFTRYIEGDATYETMTFPGGGRYFVISGDPIFLRGYGSVFYSYSCYAEGKSSNHISSRACIWVGDGI